MLDVMPGTISYGIFAAAKVSASSPTRPKIDGSPPLIGQQFCPLSQIEEGVR